MTSSLGQEEIDEVLVDEGIGVLSLANGEGESYGIPESFGYDGQNLFFQFVYDEDSKKMAFLETTEIATFTVCTESPVQSVLVSGGLEPVPDAATTEATTALAENANIPTLNVHPDSEPDAIAMEYYRMVPTEFSGRQFRDFAPVSTDD